MAIQNPVPRLMTRSKSSIYISSTIITYFSYIRGRRRRLRHHHHGHVAVVFMTINKYEYHDDCE